VICKVLDRINRMESGIHDITSRRMPFEVHFLLVFIRLRKVVHNMGQQIFAEPIANRLPVAADEIGLR